jgi:hypothetical protein
VVTEGFHLRRRPWFVEAHAEHLDEAKAKKRLLGEDELYIARLVNFDAPRVVGLGLY